MRKRAGCGDVQVIALRCRRQPFQVDGGSRRGRRMIITAAGSKIRKAMRDVYGPAMQAVVGERLNAGETVKLAKLLEKLIPDES